MPPRKRVLLDVVALLAIVLIAVVGYKLSPLLLPRADLTVMPEPGCDLHRKACAANLADGGRVELSILPRPIPMLTTLQVEVKGTGIDVARVDVDFAGVDMNMGLNRPALVAAGPGLFRGEAALPVCVTGNMQWQATVLVESPRSRIAVPFRFDSQPR
jgi:hypothetical protein